MPEKWYDLLTYLGGFFFMFTGYLRLARGPASTPEQMWFRIGLAVVGIGLFMAGTVIRALKNRSPRG